ncbi:unnamed protein product, partial [Discosporangium mesarthrocarpum]
FTYASHKGRDDRFCRTLESAVRNNVPLRIIGWQKPWRGLSQKLSATLEAVSRLPESTVVMFTDAFDVLYAWDLMEIKRRFLKMKVDILFSAECGCWPQVQRERKVCWEDYPKSPTPYR